MRSPDERLLGSLTLRCRELIDAPCHDCDHEMSFPLRVSWCGTGLRTGALRKGK
jgi:hypothetical protein